MNPKGSNGQCKASVAYSVIHVHARPVTYKRTAALGKQIAAVLTEGVKLDEGHRTRRVGLA